MKEPKCSTGGTKTKATISTKMANCGKGKSWHGKKTSGKKS
jgi:hypothetical protein